MKPSSKNEIMNLIVQTYKDLKKLKSDEEGVPSYADARKGWRWFNGANIRFDEYLYGADGKVFLDKTARDYNNFYFLTAWEGELPEGFTSAYMLSTAKVFLENETEKDCIAIYNVHKKDNGFPNVLEQYFLPMNDIGAIKMIKVTATDDDGSPADCSSVWNNLKIEYIQTDETSDSVLKMLLVLDQILSTTSNVDAPTNEQFERLVKAMPTDINVDANGYAILEHDGKEITGQKKKVKFATQTDMSAKQSVLYRHTITIYEGNTQDGNSICFTTYTPSNTPIDSIQDLTASADGSNKLANTDLECFGVSGTADALVFYNKIHVGTSISNTTLQKVTGGSATLASVYATYTMTDDVTLN